MKYLPPELLDEMTFYIYPNQNCSRILTSSWLLMEFLRPHIERWKKIFKILLNELIDLHKLCKEEIPWRTFTALAEKDKNCNAFVAALLELVKEDAYASIDGSGSNALLIRLRELYPSVIETLAWTGLQTLNAELFPSTQRMVQALRELIETTGLYFGAVPKASSSKEHFYHSVACVGDVPPNVDDHPPPQLKKIDAGVQSTSSSTAPIPKPLDKSMKPPPQRLPGDFSEHLYDVPPTIDDHPPPQLKQQNIVPPIRQPTSSASAAVPLPSQKTGAVVQSLVRRLPLSSKIHLPPSQLQKRVFGHAGLSLCPQPSADNSPFPPPQEQFPSSDNPPKASASVQGSVQGQKSRGEEGRKDDDETSPGSEPKRRK